ncbi:MAG: class I SAM-dependent methyltransferase [Pseudolabrys sp.]
MTAIDTIDRSSGRQSPGWTARMLRALVPQPAAGSLRVVTSAGEAIDFIGRTSGIESVVVLERSRAVWRLVRGGEVGFAEAYMDGDWTTPDLPRFLEWALSNETDACGFRGHVGTRLVRRIAHGLRANTKRGSRRNIAAHYDLGNDFYNLWLDPGMSYSSGIYASGIETLDEAQEAKLDRIAALLDVKAGDSVLEIGCGWGGVLERLLTRQSCHMTALTLSTEQLRYAQERVDRLSVQDRADIRLQDYRDVGGQFDRIVSIEMLEAVGEHYWPIYFDKLRACLKPGGTCVLQVITIAEDRFPGYRSNPDFIQSYIFPGGMLPTKSALRDAASRAGLSPGVEEAFGLSYARTLQDWRNRFARQGDAVAALGLDARFRRMWDYYLSYCEAGFRGGAIDVSLFQLRG